MATRDAYGISWLAGNVVGPVVGFFGAVIFGVGAGASLAYTLAVNIARIALLSLVSKALAPKIDLQQTAQNKSLTFKSAIGPQGFVYGQDLLSGPLLFAQVTGENNEFLHRVVALTGREIDSFVSFRFDDEDIAIGDSPLTGIAAIPGTVAAGKWQDVVYIDARTGTDTQTVFTQLNTDIAGNWTSAHRGRGWSMIYTKMTLDPNKPDAFQTGAPQNLKAIVKGHKIYDPRKDSTRVIDSTTSPATTGTGTHRFNDRTTWEWSDNPALCLADWLAWDIVGLGEPDTRIDWELVAAAADKCDELVVIPPAASPSNTQKRYTCNLTFYSDQERGGVKQILEESMLGRCIFSQGQWRMWAGAAYPATITLSEANLAGKFQLEAGTPSKERYNRVVGKYVDPDRDYQAVAYPEQLNGTWAIDDGGDKPKTFDFNACNNTYEAQRNAIIRLCQSRNQRIVVFEGNWSCFQIQPGRTVNVDFAELSWASPAEKFLVTEWALRPDGTGVDLTLIEETDACWNDPAVGDYTTRTPTGPLVPPSRKAVKLTGTTIANSLDTGTAFAGVRLGADGQVYYQLANGQWSSVVAPDDEWLRQGSGYSFRATLGSPSAALDTGSVGVWESDAADRSYGVQSSGGSKTAVVTIEITDDPAASPVPVITQGTFTLTAEIPIPVDSLYLVGTTYSDLSGTYPYTFFGLRFSAGAGAEIAGGLYVTDGDSGQFPSGYRLQDGLQWHTGQDLATPSLYAVRFTNDVGPTNINSGGGTEDVYRQLNVGRDIGMDFVAAGTYTNTSDYELGNWNDSPITAIASATITLSFVQ
jgi:hypothetical protein